MCRQQEKLKAYSAVWSLRNGKERKNIQLISPVTKDEVVKKDYEQGNQENCDLLSVNNRYCTISSPFMTPFKVLPPVRLIYFIHLSGIYNWQRYLWTHT